MKKVVVTVFLPAVMWCCKKDFVCECTSSGGGPSTSTSFTLHNTKRKASKACEASAAKAIRTTTCELK